MYPVASVTSPQSTAMLSVAGVVTMFGGVPNLTYGVALFDDVYVPVPRRFLAATRTLYSVPLVKPVMVAVGEVPE